MSVTYHEAGVDVKGADAWIARMRKLIRSTHSRGVLPDLGRFAGLFRLHDALRLDDPVLVASTDGVGTKLKIAQWARMHEGIGIDAVAMNTNDVVCVGARPIFFLDYLAVGALQSTLMDPLLRGIVKGCRQSGCALLGGETAEMPGLYGPGEYDIAGFCVGIVERTRLIDGSRVRAGNKVVGLASSGLHANGFSLVRKVLGEDQWMRFKRALLMPTRIYVKPVLKALGSFPIHAIAHITGGGLSRRLQTLVAQRPGLKLTLNSSSWRIPSIFQTIQRAGGIMSDEMARTFNMGIGMALVCDSSDGRRLVAFMKRQGVSAWIIGAIENG